jgi:hypothetical protein
VILSHKGRDIRLTVANVATPKRGGAGACEKLIEKQSKHSMLMDPWKRDHVEFSKAPKGGGRLPLTPGGCYEMLRRRAPAVLRSFFCPLAAVFGRGVGPNLSPVSTKGIVGRTLVWPPASGSKAE